MKKLIKTKALIDGTGHSPLPHSCFEITDGWVSRVGKQEDFGSEKYELVDLSDYYILPGFIDSHTHLSINPSLGNQIEQMRLPAGTNIIRSMPHIKTDLQSGVTTMRIMGEEHYIDIDIKKGIREGLIPGPDLLVSGKGITASNGHGMALTACDGVDEVRKQARLNLAKGADLLKLFVTGGVSSAGSKGLNYCSYSREEIRAAVEEAQREGKHVAAHAHGGSGIDFCLEEGVRTIEHAVFITEKQIEQAIKKQAWIIGTFSILFHPKGIEYTDFNIPEIREKLLAARETAEKNFNKVIESKVGLALGTDSMHGCLGFEMECLTRFGATNMQAICAVTKNAAEACQIDNVKGTIEPGKIADFVAIKENPLESIQAVNNIEIVFKKGKIVYEKKNRVWS